MNKKYLIKKELKNEKIFHPKKLVARFVSKNSHRGGEECIIIDFSQKGVGVKVFSIEDIIIGSNVILEVFILRELKPIIVKGTIKWSKKTENGYISGVELSR